MSYLGCEMEAVSLFQSSSARLVDADGLG